jgi:uncharacterized protein
MIIDIHSHLLNPDVRFDRWFDRLALFFFSRTLGFDAKKLRDAPFEEYLATFVRLVRESRFVDRCCILPVDGKYDAHGNVLERDRTVCSSSDQVWDIAARYPDVFIPFCSINPIRPDAVTRLEQAIAQGFRGVKFLQNYWCVDTKHRAFIPFYDTIAQHGLPLIIHLGSESTVSSCAEHETLEMLHLPLERGVTVIAAHMAAGFMPRQYRQYLGLLELLEKHENLYADLSATLTPNRAGILKHLQHQTHIHHKLLFGTDFPVPFTVLWNRLAIPFSRRRQIAHIANPFDRYVLVLQEYFGEDSVVFQNWRKVITGC